MSQKTECARRGAYRCELRGCGGYTKVLRVIRALGMVTRYRRCTTCGAKVTTREVRCGEIREAS